MNKYKNYLIAILFLLLGCSTTVKIIVDPVKYNPSILEKNLVKVSYYIDDNLKTLTEKEGSIIIYKVFLGECVYKTFKDMMEQIFYDPKEVAGSETTGIVIKFTKVDSQLVRKIEAYKYSISINMKIYKDGKLIKEITYSGHNTCEDYFAGRLVYPNPKEQVKDVCLGAIVDVVSKIGAFLMKYNFEV